MRKPRTTPVKAKGGKTPHGGHATKGGAKKPGTAAASHALHPAGTARGAGTLKRPSPKGKATGSGTLAPKKAAAKKAPKKRQWSPGSDVACCAAEAFGTLVEASGRPWSAEQTLALYWSTADTPDAGASIWATLSAADVDEVQVHRLAGELPDRLQHHGKLQTFQVGQLDVLQDVAVALLDDDPPEVTVSLHGHGGDVGRRDPSFVLVHGLILGVALPQPHAIAVTPDGRWWSWGEPFNPGDWPELAVDEAWAVLL